MGADNTPLATFNRGIVDSEAFGRVDLKRVALSAATQTNWIPRAAGAMSLRPGLEYIDGTRNNAETRHIPFIYAVDDTAIVELTDLFMRIRVDEQIVERVSVSSAVTNGNFTTDLTGWTDADESGATSAWAAGGYLSLIGTRFNAAIRRQTVTVAAADRNIEHGLKVVVNRGLVTLKVGSTSGDDDYIAETQLGVGDHSLALTPTGGSFFIEVSAKSQAAALLDSINVESAGAVTLTTPWTSGDFDDIRFTQSADVIFVASNGYQQRKIERRGTRSWSLVLYETEDGPFRPINATTIKMTPTAVSGDTTLTASDDFFQSGHVGALFRVTSIGQSVEVDVTAEDQFSDTIVVTGAGATRNFDVVRAGTWVATVTLQQSPSEPGNWVDLQTYTGNGTTTVNDALTNGVVYYRVGVKAGNFTSGTVEISMTYSSGTIDGVCRVTSITSSLAASVAVLSSFGQTTSSETWHEGLWSGYRGYPTSVALYEGRLWWTGKDKIAGSVSDAYASFDDTVEGESAPIIRSIGLGSVDTVAWTLPLQRLMLGTDRSIVSVRSTSLDELLTTTNFNIKEASNQGSSRVAAERIDGRGVFVQANGKKLYEISFNPSITGEYDYLANDLSVLVPEIGDPGFVRIAVQRQPDTRIHCLRADGTVAMLLFNPLEDLKAWVDIETGDADGDNGAIEDVLVMPGGIEDAVYYTVKRTIDGATVRYLEKLAPQDETIGGTYDSQADAFTMFINNPASATVTGLDHLEGESVVCWADGKCLKDGDGAINTFTVASGSITLTDEGASYSASQGIVGLAYKARFKSAKLPYAASLSTPLTQRQRIAQIGLMIKNTHNQGLKFGRDFTNMDNLSKTIEGATVDDDAIHSDVTIPGVTFPGESSADARLCLEANAPRPATVTAAVLSIGTFDKRP